MALLPGKPREARRLDMATKDSSVQLTNLPAGVPPTVRAAFAPANDEASAEAYTRELAHSHYENFSVVSRLLPRHLRQDFCNVYSFCRIADDLGDEVHNPSLSLQLLADFRRQTLACYAGDCQTAVFTALSRTIKRWDIPARPFLDLIDAFEQDQRVTRYATFDQVLDYCRRSADPVGRLVLYMGGYRDEQRQRLSDQTCSALQLVNFWQDVRRDITDRDRVYLPQDSMDRFGVTVEQLRQGRFDSYYRDLLEFECQRCSAMFAKGRQLLPLIRPSLRPQITLFSLGGEAVLRAIRRKGFDTLTARPSLSKATKARLMLQAIWGMAIVAIAPGRSVAVPQGGSA